MKKKTTKKARKRRMPRIYAAQKLNARRTARAVKRANRAKPRRRRYGIAGIPVTDHRLLLARGRHAVAVLLARAIGNANQMRISCHVVGNTNNPEAARQEAMQIAKMEATRTGELGWSVVETCVTAIYQ